AAGADQGAGPDTAELVRETLRQRRAAAQPAPGSTPGRQSGVSPAVPAEPHQAEASRVEASRTASPAEAGPTDETRADPRWAEPSRAEARSRVEPARSRPSRGENTRTDAARGEAARGAPGGAGVDRPVGGIDAAAVRRVWPEVLEAIKRRSR